VTGHILAGFFMHDEKNRITIRDVARASGVSYQTVSRVINGSPNVSENTRQRVQQVMDDLNYQPNKAAQMLTTNRSFLLETILVNVDLPGNLAKSTKTMVHTAKTLNYSLLVSECQFEELGAALESATSRLVDGVVIYAPNSQISDEELLDICEGMPFVRRDYVPGSKVAWVGFDQVYAAQLAVDHLVALGHQQIAEICPDLRYINGYWRHRGWEEALQAHGLTPGPSVSGVYSMQSGYEGALSLLESDQDFSAIVIGTDKMALGAMRALREKGIRIPEDISVVSMDNAELAAYVDPPLTTVEFKFEKQDELVVKYLVELIRDPDIEVHQRVLMPSLIIRESTRLLA
jgi:DNA-binding LacI/PurR family transcriptional regulator